MDNAIVTMRGVSKSYLQGGNIVHALKPCDLDIARGEIVALVGASGCGKSTLLHIAGLLLSADTGSLIIDGKNCADLSDTDRTLVRRDKLGFVYQFHHLLPELSVLENVLVPLHLQKNINATSHKQAHILLDELGLAHRTSHMTTELSGGEQQRVAIARALIHQPALLLADEPTGNLDPETGKQIEQLMVDTLRSRNGSALIVTHNHALATRMDRIITLGN